MNFYEQEMRQMFGDNVTIKEPVFVGKTMIGKLDSELRAKLQFVSTGTSKHYDAIQVSIINRTNGLVDKETMLFGDIIGLKNSHGVTNVNPHMWENDNNGRWYTPITLTEKAQIADTVLEYVEQFQEESLSYSPLL